MSIAGQLWVWLSGASWGQAELDPSRCRRSTSLEARARTQRQQGLLPGERLKGTGEDACGPASPCLPSQAFPELPQGTSLSGPGKP